MSKYKVEVNSGNGHAEHEHEHAADEGGSAASTDGNEFASNAATIGVVVVGAALLETALIPGIILGAAAALAPKYLPKLGDRLQPLFQTTVRGVYKLGRKARAAVGEVQENMSDIVAEVHAEEVAKASESAPLAEGVKA